MRKNRQKKNSSNNKSSNNNMTVDWWRHKNKMRHVETFPHIIDCIHKICTHIWWKEVAHRTAKEANEGSERNIPQKSLHCVLVNRKRKKERKKEMKKYQRTLKIRKHKIHIDILLHSAIDSYLRVCFCLYNTSAK